MAYTTASVRQDIVARLVAAPAVVATIMDSRSAPIPSESLPAIVVETVSGDDETRSASGGAPTMRTREDVAVEVHVDTLGTDATVASLRDALKDAARDALFKDPVWVAQFEGVSNVRTTYGVDSKSERLRSIARSIYTLQWTERHDPVFAEDTDLDTVVIEVDMIDPGDGPDGTTDAGAIIDLAGVAPATRTHLTTVSGTNLTTVSGLPLVVI